MKNFKFYFLAVFLFSLMGANAQTYCFKAPQGFAAGTTGGGSGSVTVVTNKTELGNALTASGSGIVLVKGSIQCDYLSVLVTNKTLLGLPGAKLYTNDQTSGKSGILYIKPGSNNVIIRNLIFVGPGAYDSDGRDCLTNEGTKVWVDHCEFQDGMDGNFDNKGKGDNITVSWCKFTYLKAPKAGGSGGTDDHRYSNLVGSSDSAYPSDGSHSITWQYCWWADGCVERMVRARNSTLHQLNCYWSSSDTKTAIGLSAGVKGCSDYVESSVFNCTGKVSNLGYGGSPRIKFANCTGGGSDVGSVSKPSYTYEVTPVGSVVSAVTNASCGAGATLNVSTSGVVSASCGSSSTVSVSSVSLSSSSATITSSNGTVQLSATVSPSNATNKSVTWTSSNTSVATVSSSGLVTGKANGSATITVKTSDGGKTATASITVNIGSTPPPPTTGGVIHNFTTSGSSSSFYAISGNLSTSKGTVSYNGLTLTQCLKIESSTTISFTAAQAGVLTLVFNSSYNDAIKIDGSTSANASSGILKISVSAGKHTLTKSGSTNLYYIDLTYGATLKSAAFTDETVTGTSALDFKFYPNPVQSTVTLEFNTEENEASLIQIFSLDGSLLLNQQVTSKINTIDLSSYNSGIYFIKASNSQNTLTKRLIKQ